MEKKQMLQIYLIYHINLCKMYASTKFSNILKSEKAKMMIRNIKHSFLVNIIILYPLKRVTSHFSMYNLE